VGGQQRHNNGRFWKCTTVALPWAILRQAPTIVPAWPVPPRAAPLLLRRSPAHREPNEAPEARPTRHNRKKNRYELGPSCPPLLLSRGSSRADSVDLFCFISPRVCTLII